jgi:hypothetical protein
VATRKQAAVRDVAYIEQHWEPLAALAWAGHLADGPGAVVIDRRVGRAPAISYANEAALIAQAIAEVVPDMLDHLAGYDPASEVVFIVHWEDRTLGYRLRAAELPPPSAYVQAQRIARPPAA